MIFDPREETWLITVEDVELLTETAVPIADGVMSVVSVTSGRVVQHAALAAETVFVSQESRRALPSR